MKELQEDILWVGIVELLGCACAARGLVRSNCFKTVAACSMNL